MTLQDQVLEDDRQRLERVQKAALPIWQLKAMEAGCLRSCINCEHFTKSSEGCAIAGESRPPAMVIALGCDSWMHEIPF